MNIVIIGAGSFGSALAKVFAETHAVTLYTIEDDVYQDISVNQRNSKYLGEVSLSGVSVSKDISIVQSADCIILCVPSMVTESVCKEIRPFYTSQIVISAGKGLTDKGELLTDVIKRELTTSSVLALSGPSFALELANQAQTYVSLAGDKELATQIKQELQTSYFHLHVTSDIAGIQVLGFYKNIIAILIGICDGLALPDNFRAALLTKAYSEFYYLNIDTFHRHSFIGYAGLGDLFLTVSSSQSRNKQFGELFAKGLSVTQILHQIGQVVEGYDSLQKAKEAVHIAPYFEEELFKTLQMILTMTDKYSIIAELERYLKKVSTKK